MKKQFLFVLSLIIGISANGCGGGTRGSGDGQIYSGFVHSLDGAALTGVSVTITQTGDNAVTDGKGEFSIETETLSGKVEFLLENNSFSSKTSSEAVSSEAKNIFIEFTVGTGNKPTVTTNVQVTEVKPKPTKTPKPTSSVASTGTSSSPSSAGSSVSNQGTGRGEASSDSSDDDQSEDFSSESSSDSSEDKSSKGNSSSSSSSSSSASSSSKSSSSSSSSSTEGLVVRAEGAITTVNSSVVEVKGVSFVPSTQTQYRGKNGQLRVLSDFSAGEQVKAEGKITQGVLVLQKLELR